MEPELLVDPSAVADGLNRIAKEIAARVADDVALIGIRRGGEPVAQELGRILGAITGNIVLLGLVDITLYRDDAATALPSPPITVCSSTVTMTGTLAA